jgi:hypothetical protein
MPTPDFESVYSAFETTMLKDAYEAITVCDLWDWMRTYSPEEGKGFMFTSHPNLDRIEKEMKFGGHSGASWGWTMRTMEAIAKRGWDTVKNEVRTNTAKRQLEEWAREIRSPDRGTACPCRRAQGYKDGWCGVAGGGVPGCDH